MAHRTEAAALQARLGAAAFLDAVDLDDGEAYPRALFEAVADAHVFVLLASALYFQRWYCLRELRIARARYDARPTNLAIDAQQRLLRHLVVVLPDGGEDVIDLLPQPLRGINWPRLNEQDAIVALVQARLAECTAPVLGAADLDGDLLAGLQEEAALPPPGNLATIPFYALDPFPPSLGARFVGRASLLERAFFEIATARGGIGAAALTASMGGTGGIGKTRAAIELVWRYGPRHFPGGVFWINAASEDRREQQFHGALSLLEPTTPALDELRRSERDVVRLLRAALARAGGRASILWVIDNFPEPGPNIAPEPLETWCPGLGAVTVLITTRLRLIDASVTSIDVPPLERAGSKRLLARGLAKDAMTPDQADTIAKWVGDLPLALEILHSGLLLGIVTATQLVELSATAAQPGAEIDVLYENLQPYLPRGALRGVVSTLRISADRLPADARFLAAILAQLAPIPIPMAVLDGLGAYAPVSARAALITRSIAISYGGKTFGSLHRLVADFFRSLPAPGDSPPLVVARRVMIELLPDDLEASIDGIDADALLAHGAALLDRPHAPEPADVELVHRLVILGLIAMRARETIEMAMRGMRLADAVHGPKHELTVRAHMDHAVAGWQIRAPWVRGVLEHLLLELEASPHVDQALEARLLLGLVLSHQGNLDGALAQFQAVYQAHVADGSRSHLRSIHALLGILRVRVDKGDISADEVDRWVAVLARADLPDRPQTIELFTQAGYLLAAIGAHPRALEAQDRAVALAQRLLGPESPTTLQLMLEAAESQFALGEFESAKAIEEHVYSIRERIFGASHTETLLAANNLALTMKHLGETEESVVLLERVVAGQRDQVGPDHAETLRSQYNLAGAYLLVDRRADALALMAGVVVRRRSVLGPGHHETLVAELSHAILAEADDPLRVLTELTALLKRCRDALGDDHKVTTEVRQTLGKQLWDAGELGAALECLRHVCATQRRVAPGSPSTRETTLLLALLLQELGRSDVVATLLEELGVASPMALADVEHHEQLWSSPLGRVPRHLRAALVRLHERGSRYVVLDEPSDLIRDERSVCLDRWLASSADGGSYRVVALVPSFDDFIRYNELAAVAPVGDADGVAVANTPLRLALDEARGAPVTVTGFGDAQLAILDHWLARVGALNTLLGAIGEAGGSALAVGGEDLLWLRVLGDPKAATIVEHRQRSRVLRLHNPYVLDVRRGGASLRALLTIALVRGSQEGVYIAIDALTRGEPSPLATYVPIGALFAK